jgi:anti-sigma regulatory factor (Ser/Thr protein kinase)
MSGASPRGRLTRPARGSRRKPSAHIMRWQRIFRGRKSQVREARHFVRFLLAGCPVRENDQVHVMEPASNACLHTASRHDGWFGVEVSRQPGLVVVAVADGGGPGRPAVQADDNLEPDESGYGLRLVDALSDRWDSEERRFGRVTWAVFTWGPGTSTGSAAFEPGDPNSPGSGSPGPSSLSVHAGSTCTGRPAGRGAPW